MMLWDYGGTCLPSKTIADRESCRAKPETCILQYKRNKQVVASRHMVCLGIYSGNSLSISEDSLCNGLRFLTFRGLIQSFWTSFNWWLFCVCPGVVPTEHALARVPQAWSQDSNTSALYKKILAANYQPPSFISESVKDLISGLLTVDPAKRCLPKMISFFAVWLVPASWMMVFIRFFFEFRALFCDAFGSMSVVNACLVSWGFTIADVRAHPWYKQAPRQVKGFRSWVEPGFDLTLTSLWDQICCAQNVFKHKTNQKQLTSRHVVW